MTFTTLLCASLLLPLAVSGCDTRDTGGDSAYTKNGLKWTKGELRMNEIQVVGSHNSYHVEGDPKEAAFMTNFDKDAINFRYSHSALDVQFENNRVRSMELDILADPKGGNYAKPIIRKVVGLPYPSDPTYQTNSTKVMHVPDLDVGTVCASLVQCLTIIKGWIDNHPRAVPIPILLEFTTAEKLGGALGGSKIVNWDDADLLNFVDSEIRSVFGSEQLLVPDDIRREGSSLEASVLEHGWPDLNSARGRIFFLMDNGPGGNIRKVYRDGRPNLEGRVIFTNSAPGEADCAFQKHNDPVSDDAVANIQKQVASGYWVRTRSDVPLDTVIDDKCSTSRRDAALRSGAQIVSTDFPAYGMSARWGCDYAVRMPGGRTARCNPVVGPKTCDDASLEPAEYSRN